MNETISFHPIAHIRTEFPTKFGIPRQSGLAEHLYARIIFAKEYRHPEALRGLENFSHIWLIWQFSESIRPDWSPTVRPPRLGGNQRMGVFATRSPFRPNPIGLSAVKLEKIELSTPQGSVLHVSGADLMDNTPILDIKPYLPFTDSHPEARGGFSEAVRAYQLHVCFAENLLQKIPAPLRPGLLEILAQDPRPSYHHDPTRIYGFFFSGWEIRFRVENNQLEVVQVEPI